MNYAVETPRLEETNGRHERTRAAFDYAVRNIITEQAGVSKWGAVRMVLFLCLAPELLLCQFIPQQGLTDLPIRQPSPALRRVYARTKEVSPKPIVFNTTLNLRGAQGTTDCDSTDKCEITIRLDFPHDHTEAVIAHELIHIQLNREGYQQTHYWVPPILRGTPDMRWYTELAKQLTDCAIHPIIDRRLTVSGISPRLTIERGAQSTLRYVEGLSHQQRPDEAQANYLAVATFCLALREGALERSKMEKALAGSLPSVFQLEQQLWRQFAARSCVTPNSCFELTKEIRSSLVSPQTMLLENPSSHQFE